VTHPSFEHDRDGLESAVRMIGEAADVGVGITRVDSVEQYEGIEVAERRLPDNARKLHPGAVRRRHPAQDLLHAPLRPDGDGWNAGYAVCSAGEESGSDDGSRLSKEVAAGGAGHETQV
jgi:hypothetical protein